ncbi:hypothetical protein K466DRAFT_589966 [Polyporus arcularius HHB13444]|uniref:Uncharacterized protein n=1 Tax=Polyporus arcularius HHB13444 TaxID=1314778 RepID=A0A5C3P1J3_9APHY|nr:hypothetical protein K466DRAFT_589966 [Polyporus arcularius HHB13444]
MSTGARVHVTETLDVAQAKYIHDLAKVAKDGLQELYSRWYALGSSVIDVVMRVGSLAFFTAIAIGAAYSVFSRQTGRTDRDRVPFQLLSVIALWWISAAASAVTVLSKALRRYHRLASDMSAIADQLDGVAGCSVSASDCAYAFYYYKPVYTYAMDRCVGTMALSAKEVAMEALVCVFMWSLLKSGTAKLVKGGILALLIATVVSAAVHTKHACWPEPVPAESRIPPWNIVEEDLEIDSTVALALWLAVQRAWDHRHLVKIHHNGSPAHIQSSAVAVCVVPLGALVVLTLICEAFWGPRNLAEYGFLSWINGFGIPLLGVCPCLALLAYRFRTPSEGVTKVESDVGGGP